MREWREAHAKGYSSREYTCVAEKRFITQTDIFFFFFITLKPRVE